MEVLDNQNWTQWRVWPSTSFGAQRLSGTVQIRVMFTPMLVFQKARSLRSLTSKPQFSWIGSRPSIWSIVITRAPQSFTLWNVRLINGLVACENSQKTKQFSPPAHPSGTEFGRSKGVPPTPSHPRLSSK